MPADIVNLNKFRKAKERADKERQAEQNRAKFGQTKDEKLRETDEQARRDNLLDGARLTGADAASSKGTNAPDVDLDPGTVS